MRHSSDGEEVSAADVALEAARIAADLILALVPPDTAKSLIDDAAIRRANLVADGAEFAKFHLAELDDPGDPLHEDEDEITAPGAK